MRALLNPWLLGGAALGLLAALGAGFHIGRTYEASGWQERLTAAVAAEQRRVETEARNAEKQQDVIIAGLRTDKAELERDLEETKNAANAAPGADRICLDAGSVQRLSR